MGEQFKVILGPNEGDSGLHSKPYDVESNTNDINRLQSNAKTVVVRSEVKHLLLVHMGMYSVRHGTEGKTTKLQRSCYQVYIHWIYENDEAVPQP